MKHSWSQCTFILTVPSLKQKRGTYRNEGANSIGAFINKDKVEGGGACQTGGAYWKEGAKTNHYGISLLQHQNYCDQTNQTMYFSRTLGEGSVWGKRVWVQGPLRRNIFQTIIAKTSINIYPFMLTITTFTKVSNWRESNLLKGNTSKYRYSK